ncbi:MAG TPA: T9SS type A sorting domain-containing protein, partial [Flavipsychrobacter sp.]|nr:T9SS type A sorting domain-containing protein [Flavipsychrobacter sp.]
VTFTATAANAGNNPKYQWKRNGQDVQGATGAVWSANTLNDNDSVSVEIVSNYKCPQPAGAASNGIVVKVLATVGGLKGVGELTLYPNPNNGKFILKGKIPSGEALRIEIVNALGQAIYNDNIISLGIINKEINLPDIAAGIYLLRLQSENDVSSIRFSVK